jgi:hypothetical protein
MNVTIVCDEGRKQDRGDLVQSVEWLDNGLDDQIDVNPSEFMTRWLRDAKFAFIHPN